MNRKKQALVEKISNASGVVGAAAGFVVGTAVDLKCLFLTGGGVGLAGSVFGMEVCKEGGEKATRFFVGEDKQLEGEKEKPKGPEETKIGEKQVKDGYEID